VVVALLLAWLLGMMSICHAESPHAKDNPLPVQMALAAPKTLTVTSPVCVQFYGSSNLTDWAQLGTGTNIVLTATNGCQFVRGAVGYVDVPLTWDASRDCEVAGYRIYFGSQPQTYTESVDVGNVTNALVTVLQPSPAIHFAATSYDAFGDESVPSDEAVFGVKQPLLTIQ
jgi:hypothetical protein